MSFTGIYETAGSAMTAQTVRLNTISSNLANADSVSGNVNDVYKPLKPVFSSIYDTMNQNKGNVPVMVADVIELDNAFLEKYEPHNPISNEDGFVYYSGVNVINEMSDMMNSTRSFEANVSVLTNVKTMQQSLLSLWSL